MTSNIRHSQIRELNDADYTHPLFMNLVYEELVLGTYEAITIRGNQQVEDLVFKFATNDPVADYRNAIKTIIELGLWVLCSSDVDNFIIDNPEYELYYDNGLNEDLIRRVSSTEMEAEANP